jgi:hypothetical protein
MSIKIEGKVSGFYHDITVVRNAGLSNETVESYCVEHPSKNLLLNGFFDRWLLNQVNAFCRGYVGTGTTPPVVTNTQLQSQLGSYSTVHTSISNPIVKEGSDYITSVTFSMQWGIGDIIGNLTEIGCTLNFGLSNTNLDSRALIVDVLGNLTPITVTGSDQLIAKYTLRYRIPITPQVSVVDFGGVPTTCTLETLNALDSSGWGVAISVLRNPPFQTTNTIISATQEIVNNVEFTGPIGSSSSATYTGLAFPVDTPTRRRTSFSFNAAQGNQVGPIKYLTIQSASGVRRQGIHFNPPIAKNDEKTLQLNFDYTITRG